MNPVRGLARDKVASPKDLGEATTNGIKITRLAKGLASGSTLEYADSATLHHAFKNRK